MLWLFFSIRDQLGKQKRELVSFFGQKLELSVNLIVKSFCLPRTFAYHGSCFITIALTAR
jgi:hypothetical protein